MKTNFYRFMGIGMLFFIYVQGFAQNSLWFGRTPNNPVVDPPFLYWDFLRSTSTGWVWQYRNGTATNWDDYQKTINTKDADGLFTEVTSLLWKANKQAWEIDNKSLYTYQKNTSNQVQEATWERQSPNFGGAVRFENTYVQGRLEEMKVSFRSGGQYIASSQIYIKYNGAGNRVLDSSISIQQGGIDLLASYEYDNNNRCIKNVYMGLNQNRVLDTAYIIDYTYTASGLLESTTTSYRLQSNGQIGNYDKSSYSYNTNGDIKEMIFYELNTTTNILEPLDLYQQHYDNQNKLIAMVYKTPTASGWRNTDSIVLNYLPNGGYDTAHIYHASGAAWQNQYNERLVFNKNTTGINSPNATTTALKAYPNPANETLFVELDAATSGNVDLVLMDMTGKVLKTQVVQFFAGQTVTAQLSLDGIASGIYTLQASNKTIKVIKQ